MEYENVNVAKQNVINIIKLGATEMAAIALSRVTHAKNFNNQFVFNKSVSNNATVDLEFHLFIFTCLLFHTEVVNVLSWPYCFFSDQVNRI